MGFYVDRPEGTRRLRRFRDVPIDDTNYLPVIDVLLGKGLSETLRIVFHGDPPKGRIWSGGKSTPNLSGKLIY
jgi:hypothetical protein